MFLAHITVWIELLLCIQTDRAGLNHGGRKRVVLAPCLITEIFMIIWFHTFHNFKHGVNFLLVSYIVSVKPTYWHKVCNSISLHTATIHDVTMLSSRPYKPWLHQVWVTWLYKMPHGTLKWQNGPLWPWQADDHWTHWQTHRRNGNIIRRVSRSEQRRQITEISGIE